MSFELGYDSTRFDEQDMSKFAHHYKEAIALVTEYCIADLDNIDQHQQADGDEVNPFEQGTLTDGGNIEAIAVKLNEGISENNLFCFHAYGGTVGCYQPLAEALGEQYSFYGIQTPALVGKYQVSNIEALVEVYVKSIQSVQPQGPYQLLGWSLGGLLAYEAAFQLERLGAQVAYVGLLDCHAFPDQMGNVGDNWYSAIKQMYGDKLDWSELTDKSKSFGTELVMRQAVARGYTPEEIEKEVLLRYFHYLSDIGKAQKSYKPQKSSVNIQLYKANKFEHDDMAKDIADYGWSQCSDGQINAVDVGGDHNTMVFAPHVDDLAQKIKEHLR